MTAVNHYTASGFAFGFLCVFLCVLCAFAWKSHVPRSFHSIAPRNPLWHGTLRKLTPAGRRPRPPLPPRSIFSSSFSAPDLRVSAPPRLVDHRGVSRPIPPRDPSEALNSQET